MRNVRPSPRGLVGNSLGLWVTGALLLFSTQAGAGDLTDDLYLALKQADSVGAQALAAQIRHTVSLPVHQIQKAVGNLETLYPASVGLGGAGKNDSGTVLYYAARAGEAAVVDDLLVAGANPNSINGKFDSTPLQSAAYRKLDKVVASLLIHGAKVGVTNKEQNTALHTVVRLDAQSTLDLLLKYVTLADLRVQDKNGMTPFALAQSLKNQVSIQKLSALYIALQTQAQPNSVLKNVVHQVAFQQGSVLKALLLQKNKAASVKDTFTLDQVQVEKLSHPELSDILNLACSTRHESGFAAKLCFEVRDQMIRIAEQDSQAHAYFQAHCAQDPVLSVLDFSRAQFHSLDFSATGFSPTVRGASIRVSPHYKNQNQKLLVFHASVSFHGPANGGMGAYLESFIHSQHKHLNQLGLPDFDGREVNAFYDFYKLEVFGPEAFKRQKDLFSSIRFDGFIEHEVDGKIRKSSVYELKTDGIVQYLIQPDPSYRPSKAAARGSDFLMNGRYATYNEDTALAYFTTAMSALATLFKGENGNENVDILVAHDRKMALVSANMYYNFNPMRIQAKLPKIPTVAILHNQSGIKNRISASMFTRSGLPTPTSADVRLYPTHAVFSDATRAVSKAYSLELSSIKPDLGLGDFFGQLRSADLFDGITSGIDTERFSPNDAVALGSLVVQADLSDFSAQKILAKKQLFQAGLIGSETLPLFLYVGRFADQKGIDLLPAFAKFVLSQGGQMVVMGPGDGAGAASIVELGQMQKDPQYKGLFRLYTSVPQDQTAPLLSAGATTKRGHILRFASDFTFVPSIQEAGGLVPIEAFAMGNGVITSHVSGIQDRCKPLNSQGIDGKFYDVSNFSCIPFKLVLDTEQTYIKDLPASIKNMLSSVKQGLNEWNQLSTDEQEAARLRWVREAREFGWNHPGGSMDQYKALFDRLVQTPETQTQQQTKKQLIKKFIRL